MSAADLFAGASGTVAVLGVGGVGGVLAGRLAAADQHVVCVCTPRTAAAIETDGLLVTTPTATLTTAPRTVQRLEEPVALLVVAVKAPALAEALERIEVFAVADGVVLTLLNGLEHPEVVRRRLGPRVAPGSISSFQAHATAPGRIVQATPTARVTAASDDVTRPALERALEPLRAAGVEVVVEDDERSVLWEKAARLGPLAAATVASGRDVGGLRDDPVWRDRLRAAIAEACAAADADGVALSPQAEWAIIEAMPATLTTSAARDAAAGRETELDAIAGSIVRAAGRLGVPCPALRELLAEAQAR